MSDWIPEPPEVEPRADAATHRGPALRNVVVASTCLVLLGMCVAWANLSMRAVMGVGGSCASGGPYEIATPCPDGTWLIAVAIPVMIIAALSGSGFASEFGGPNMVVGLWAVLFGSLGWNFLEYGVVDGFVLGWVLCGVVFVGMAAPALWGIATTFVRLVRTRPSDLTWWVMYGVLGSCGAFLGVAVYASVATS